MTPLQLREEKITLENALEAESESHVNRLNRELSILRARQRGADELEPPTNSQNFVPGSDPRFPTPEAMLDAMRKENESLRNKLVDTERDYVRIARLNEVYREELIDHRRRVSVHIYIKPFSFLSHQSFPIVGVVCRQSRRSAWFCRRSIFTAPPPPICVQLSEHFCLPAAVTICSTFSPLWCTYSAPPLSAAPTKIAACS